jgi:L-ribulokinase
MIQPGPRRFEPRPAAVAIYDRLYAIYRELHDLFGGVAPTQTATTGTLMKRLLDLSEGVRP